VIRVGNRDAKHATRAALRFGAVAALAAEAFGGQVMTAQPAGASTTAYAWWFIENSSDVTNGSIILAQGFNTVRGWRGGSGQPNYDECASNHGPIPKGTYTITGYSWNWGGTEVKGPVIQLPNHVCSNGKVTRTELFIHSSYPWSSGHYQSAGCIKASNSGGPSPASGDIQNIVQTHVNYGQPTYLFVQ